MHRSIRVHVDILSGMLAYIHNMYEHTLTRRRTHWKHRMKNENKKIRKNVKVKIKITKQKSLGIQLMYCRLCEQISTSEVSLSISEIRSSPKEEPLFNLNNLNSIDDCRANHKYLSDPTKSEWRNKLTKFVGNLWQIEKSSTRISKKQNIIYINHQHINKSCSRQKLRAC